MRVVFFNIGWMNNYDGIQEDSIQRGGSYNQEKIGHEVCNFTRNGEEVYGFVQSPGKIAVERLGVSKRENLAEGITVVWTASPDAGGTAIVGWYTNATVYRELQAIPSPSQKHKSNSISEYRVIASVENAHLIPIQERDFFITRGKKGGIGQSNVWYADKPESQTLVQEVVKYICSGARATRLPDVDAESNAIEGNPRLVIHFRKERSTLLTKKKRKSVIDTTGKLCCEVCGFDFEANYGEDGKGFCEVHHLKPLSQLKNSSNTTLDDLAVVCSNCHRIIHRIDPMPTIKQFARRLIKKSAPE